MTNAALIIAPVLAAAAAARQRVLDAFRMADATASDRARPLDAIGLAPCHTIDQLRADGIVREAGHGRYWLDEGALVAARQRPPRRAVLLVVITTLVALGLVALALLLTRRPDA